MAVLEWDKVSEKIFETGVSKGVLFRRNATTGEYDTGFAWNGLVSVTESPSGAESNKQYANNQVYANIQSAEEFSATLEAFTYPDEFMACDGTAEITTGVYIGQQKRETFGLAYRTEIGNDVDGIEHGYKIHLIYGGMAAPTEKAYTTINESPEASTFSWEITTNPVSVPGFKATASLVVDSTKVNSADLAALEALLYGTATVEPELPLPADIIALFGTTVDVP